MSLLHAVVFVDHHSAQVLQFGREHIQNHKLRQHQRLTPTASGGRSEHDFFGAVCDALDGITQVLITGGRQTATIVPT